METMPYRPTDDRHDRPHVAASLPTFGPAAHPDWREGLHETLTRVVDSVHEVGAAIHAAFFAADLRPTPTRPQSPPTAHAGATQTQSQA